MTKKIKVKIPELYKIKVDDPSSDMDNARNFIVVVLLIAIVLFKIYMWTQ